MQTFPLTLQQVYDLAPSSLHSLRTMRYVGDGSDIALATLDPLTQATIQQIYQTLIELLEVTRPSHTNPIHVDQVSGFLRAQGWNQQMQAIRAISIDRSDAAQNSPVIRQVLHDLRGGSLQALSMHVQMIDLGIFEAVDLERMFLLTRDHLKIMRNCIPDLDPERYAQDLLDRAHGVALLLKKWQGTNYQLPGSTAQILVDCQYDGTVADRCVEFAALDRVLYNVMNNATRFTADQQVYLIIVPLLEASEASLRFVIANRITAVQRAALEARFSDHLGELFAGGFTTGGNGVGMSICAEIITNAYGLGSATQAVTDRYLGAITMADMFLLWFHWPIAAV
jgi:signal transduction histidine kinase